MKRKLVFSAILIAGLIVFNFSGFQVFGQTQQKKTTAIQTVKYTCPMHPKVIEDKPGKCPICGMKLVEKKAMSKNQMKDSMMMNHDHTKMIQDSTTMKKGGIMHDSMMKKGKMIKDSTSMNQKKK